MDLQIALLLGQDGIVNGAIYALMALALVLVFSVTRVIFIPQGELVAFGALSMAALGAGKVPGTLWLLVALAAMVLVVELWRARRGVLVEWKSTLAWAVLFPAIAAAAVLLGRPSSIWAQSLVTLLLVTPLGPLLYRLAYRPLAHAKVLILLIVSVALHLALSGLGLLFFGAEGSRTPAFSEASVQLGFLQITGQSLWVYACSLALVGALYLFFERTLRGKALRATAVNRIGARLSGISTTAAGKACFLVAALIGVGLCNSIMYPTIYVLALPRDPALATPGATLLCMAVVGGAIVPVLTGLVADSAGLAASLVLPALCYLLIAGFARSHHERGIQPAWS